MCPLKGSLEWSSLTRATGGDPYVLYMEHCVVEVISALLASSSRQAQLLTKFRVSGSGSSPRNLHKNTPVGLGLLNRLLGYRYDGRVVIFTAKFLEITGVVV